MKEAKKRIGFFGGTFDPPHFGHLNIALSILEKGLVDEILVCPSGVPPAKDPSLVLAKSEERYQMTKLAFEGVLGIKVIDFEYKKQEPSYTIDTIEALQKKEFGVEWSLIIASDVAKTFFTWKEAKKLATLVKPLVALRAGDSGEALFQDPYFKGSIVKVREMEISSTEIRERLYNKKFCGHLVPAKVLDYIYSHHLYF